LILLNHAVLGMQIAPVGGGPARPLGVPAPWGSKAWGEDGYIYFGLANGLGRVPETGGAVDTLIADSSGTQYAVQAVLPGARGLIASRVEPGEGASLFVLDLGNRSIRPLGLSHGLRSVAAYSETGHLLVARDQFVLAQRFDVSQLEFIGNQVTVAEVSAGTVGFMYGGGTLVYSVWSGGTGLQPMIADRSGLRRELQGLPDVSFNYPEVSPDGMRVAMNLLGELWDVGDVWIYEMPDGPLAPLSLEGDAVTMSWTSDGEQVVFIKNGDAYRIPFDGSDEPRLLLDRERALGRAFIAPDGERLFFQEDGGPTGRDIGVAHLDQPGSDSLILSGDHMEGHPALSPDGRWLAYHSTESGKYEVFIRPLYGPGTRRQVSREGGTRPRWSDDGTELFFTQDERLLFVASLDVGDDIRVANVELLFEVGGQNFDVFPGDSLFVVLDRLDDAAPIAATVVLNFDAQLRQLAGGR
jgi:hypothetical protein